MKAHRKLIASAALAVAFLSAGAFSQPVDTSFTSKNVTVIAKTADTSFAS